MLRYWEPEAFAAHLSAAGFEVVQAMDAYRCRNAEGRVVSYLAQRPA